MLRICSVFAAIELCLIAVCIGTPNAYADPAEECCGDNRSAECSGCLNGYNLGPGDLWGCRVASPYPGCSTESRICNEQFGNVDKYVVGSNCSVFKEKSGGITIMKDGCQQTYCD